MSQFKIPLAKIQKETILTIEVVRKETRYDWGKYKIYTPEGKFLTELTGAKLFLQRRVKELEEEYKNS